MSAITKTMFAPSPMDVMNLETKGSKGNKIRKADEGSKGSKGSRPETKKKLEPKNTGIPGTVLPIQYGPIPPREQRKPNIMYIDPSRASSTIDASKSLASSSIFEMDAEQSAAAKTVMSWKSRSVYNAYAEKARGSSSSGKSGPVTYDGVKSLAVGSSSDEGFKSTAMYSIDSSASTCSIS